jgi:hypothetical protein
MRSFQSSYLLLLIVPLCGGWKPRFFQGRKGDAVSTESSSNADGPAIPPLAHAYASTGTSTTSSATPRTPSSTVGGRDYWMDAEIDIISAQETLRNLKSIIYYKPPVGIVAVVCVLRLIYTGRIFRLYNDEEKGNWKNSAADVLHASERRHRRHHHHHHNDNYNYNFRRQERAQTLDKYDMAYMTQGCVESVRGTLCDAALRGRSNPKALPRENNGSKRSHLLDAIHVTYRNKGPRVNYVREIASHLILADHDDQDNAPNRKNVGTILHNDVPGDDNNDEDDELFVQRMAHMVAQIRMLDALLRVARDRILTTCFRLKRLVKHWKGRVYITTTMSPLLTMGDKYMQVNRERLALALGAYQSEIESLGKIIRVLNDRPVELSETYLVGALALSTNTSSTNPATSSSSSYYSFWLNNLAIRWNAEGRGRLSIRYLQHNSRISNDAARVILQQQGNGKRWIRAAQSWIDTAQHELCNVLRVSVQKDILDEDTKRHVANVVEWCTTKQPRSTEQWESVLELVEHLDGHQRIGEGTVVSLADPKFRQWLEDADIFGIPSSFLMIGLARLSHEVLEPKWPVIQTSLLQGYEIASTIFKKRVWSPFRDIVVNLISRKNTSLLEFFDVTNEVTSLDNMLRDLGFGDGTEATRQEALILASRRYELDLKHGLMGSAVRGRLPRLLLVQVQQLKAGLLHALDGIDALVAANRLNVQLLAAIPAVLILTFGARFVVRSIYTFRLKAIRSVRDVHSEMSDYLDSMETCLHLLGRKNPGHCSTRDRSTTIGAAGTAVAIDVPASVVGSDMELGSLVLDMHSYLVLLDYSSPVFPARSLDGIHKSMQDLLLLLFGEGQPYVYESDVDGRDSERSVHNSMTNGNNDRAVQILRLVKEKHRGLGKYL